MNPDRGPGLVDTHAHLQDVLLRGDLDAVLARARESGVTRVIAVAITAADSAEVLEIARSRSGVAAAVGVHPNGVGEASADDWRRVVDFASEPGVVALGETGLDRHWDRTPFAEQQEWFGRHLELGADRDLPVVIHSREAERDVIGQLARLGRPVRGVVHSFTGTWDEAQALLRLGLHLSFAGMVTFANKSLDPLRSVAAGIPLDRLLVETDSPYLSPHPFRGRTNEPSRVATTARYIAEMRKITLGELSLATSRNAENLFRLSNKLISFD